MVLIIAIISGVIFIMFFVIIFTEIGTIDRLFTSKYNIEVNKLGRKVLNGEMSLHEYSVETNKLIKDEEMKKLNKIRKQKLNKLSNK